MIKIKNISLTILILVLTYAFTWGNQAAKSDSSIVFFNGTWAEALEKAKNENKIIFLDAYTSWCGPCKKMKAKTFTDSAVAHYYNTHFINLAIDMEKGEGKMLSDKFKVEAYPTLIYLSSSGKIYKRVVGFHDAKEFLKLGKRVFEKKK